MTFCKTEIHFLRMEITVEKNPPTPVLKSVTITMSCEQAAMLMLLIGGTNGRQKENIIYDPSHPDELWELIWKLGIPLSPGNRTSSAPLDEFYYKIKEALVLATDDNITNIR